jgi:hypothetical protein
VDAVAGIEADEAAAGVGLAEVAGVVCAERGVKTNKQAKRVFIGVRLVSGFVFRVSSQILH